MELDFAARLKQAIDQLYIKETNVTDTNVTDTNVAVINWIDPRKEDFPHDSNDWEILMSLVAHAPELHSMLNTVRGVGATLSPGKASYLIRPVIDPTGAKGWETEADYEKQKEYLNAYQGTLLAALMQLKKRCTVR